MVNGFIVVGNILSCGLDCGYDFEIEGFVFLALGFVAAHTLPVLYEKYEDEIDDFVYKLLDQLQHHYRKLDTGLLSRIPKGKFKAKKHD